MNRLSPVERLRTKARLPLFDLGGGLDTVVVAGTGRSGTTWLGELINHSNEFRTVFEPLHPHRSHEHLRTRGRPGASPPSGIQDETVHRLISGNYRSTWTDQYNRRFVYRKRLIKSIRINLCISRIADLYSEIPIFLIIRHPAINAASRIRGGWPAPLEYFDTTTIRSAHPAIDHYVENRAQLTEWERAVAFWAIETRCALPATEYPRVTTVAYEDLVTRPEATIPAVIRAAGARDPGNVQSLRLRPSAMTRKKQRVDDGSGAILDRLLGLPARDLTRCAKIVSDFELSHLYGDNGLPASDPSTWHQPLTRPIAGFPGGCVHEERYGQD